MDDIVQYDNKWVVLVVRDSATCVVTIDFR